MSSAAAAAAAPPPAPIKHRMKDEHVKHPRRRTESRLLLPSEGAPETRKGRGQAGTGGGHWGMQDGRSLTIYAHVV